MNMALATEISDKLQGIKSSRWNMFLLFFIKQNVPGNTSYVVDWLYSIPLLVSSL